MNFCELNIGDGFEETRVVDSQSVLDFAAVSGDNNPLHIDEEFAAGTLFKKRIAHGMLLVSYISAILGMKFPGRGTIYMQQEIKFMRPVFVGDSVKIRVEVAEKYPEKNRVKLTTTVFTHEGKEAVIGAALVKLEK